jgi:hypothetical protein
MRAKTLQTDFDLIELSLQLWVDMLNQLRSSTDGNSNLFSVACLPAAIARRAYC